MSAVDYSFVVSSFLATIVALRFSKGTRKIPLNEALKETGYGIAGTNVSAIAMYGLLDRGVRFTDAASTVVICLVGWGIVNGIRRLFR